MASAKATSTDVFAKLAKGECANFFSGRCQGASTCSVIEGGTCDYFTTYVKPLLDYPEFSGKYAREAKIHVALNPKSKIARKRQAGKETLTVFDAEASSKSKPKVKSAPKPEPLAAKQAAISSALPSHELIPPRTEPIAAVTALTEKAVKSVKPTIINTGKQGQNAKDSLPVPQLELLWD